LAGLPRGPEPYFSLETLQAAGVFQGGLILALVTAFVYMKQQGLPFLRPRTHSPGSRHRPRHRTPGMLRRRLLLGVACDLPWAVTFHDPVANGLTGVPLEVPLHPTQLYESVVEFALFMWLFSLYKKPHTPGRIIGLYLVLSSALRFAIEFYRVHQQGLNLGLSLTQWISVGLALVGALLLVRKPIPTSQLAQA